MNSVSESVTTPVMASIPGIPFASLATTPNSDSSIQPASAVYISTRPMELGTHYLNDLYCIWWFKTALLISFQRFKWMQSTNTIPL